MTEAKFFIGIDDTDFGDSIGTGALCRELGIYLTRELGAELQGTTRHQFLIHPDIPYTSHNSAACIEVQAAHALPTLKRACAEFIGFLFHPGADPGLCVAYPHQLRPELVDFGRRAQTEVVGMEEAWHLAAENDVALQSLGGTEQGIIGALGAVALRMDGNDGRFIAHRGIREVTGALTTEELLARTAVQEVVDEHGRPLKPNDVIETNNWIRPNLVDGQVVMSVFSGGAGGAYFAAKKKKTDDDM